MTSSRPNKKIVNSLRATEREWEAWGNAAALHGLDRSEWIRRVLAQAAEATFQEFELRKNKIAKVFYVENLNGS